MLLGHGLLGKAQVSTGKFSDGEGHLGVVQGPGGADGLLGGGFQLGLLLHLGVGLEGLVDEGLQIGGQVAAALGPRWRRQAESHGQTQYQKKRVRGKSRQLAISASALKNFGKIISIGSAIRQAFKGAFSINQIGPV